MRPLIGKKSLLFSGYQCSCSLHTLCHAAEAVVMAISCAVMDSVCDNGCNTLSVLFTLVLTWLLSVPHLSYQLCAATFDTHALTRTHIHAHRLTLWNIGIFTLTEGRGPPDEASLVGMEACIYSLYLNPLTSPRSCTNATSTSEPGPGGRGGSTI